MDDWANHSWFQREKKLLKFSEAELRNLSVEDFRFFFFGHPKPSHALEFFITATRESGIPEQLVPEVVRWIQATGRLELMPTLLKANHPTITLYLLKTQPQSFKVPTKADVISWSKDGCYMEIVYQLCSINWEKLGKKNVWDAFFAIIKDPEEDLILSDLGMTDYLLSSANCSLENLSFLLENFVDTANDIQLLWRNVTSRNVNPFVVENGVIGIAVLKLIVTQHSKALFSLLEEILKSALIAQHFTLVFETVSRSSKMPQNLRARALQTLGQNRNINSRKMLSYCVNCHPLFKGVLRRDDLLQEISFEEVLGITAEDDMLAEFLEHQGTKIVWTPALIDLIFAHIFNDGIMISIAFSKVPTLPMDTVANLLETNEYCKLQIASRNDLPIALRDVLLGDVQMDIRVAVLRYEDRPHVQKQYAAKDVQFMEVLAANPKLDANIRKSLLEYMGKSAFRVHRCLAARSDLTAQEIDSLLQKRDLDIYSNLCRNFRIKLTRENVLTLTNFAQVGEEQQDEWLPCLRLTHRKAAEGELRKMLISYQSEMRLLLLRGDSEHSLGRVDNEMKLNWTSDPDFSVTLGILQSGGEKLSNYMMQCIVDNDANVHLLEDKLLSLLPRCDEMNLETLLMVVKKGTPKVCKEILRLLPGGAKLHSLVHTANASQLPLELQLLHSDAFASPKNYIFILRAIFERQRTQADIMKAVILLLKDLVKQLGPKYEKNEDHLRTQIEDLLLDICTDLRVPREAMDEVVAIASSTVLYHLLSYGNLNYETLWAIYLKEVETAGRNSPLLRCLALRNSVPSTMRWVLALVNSRLGQESTQDGSVRNELLSVMLSGGNSIDKTLVHYFLCCEPEETVAFLHSTDLQGEELIFLRDKMLPSLKESHPVRQHFEIFASAVSKLCGTPITLSEVKFDSLTSKIMNDAIGYARDGIQLQKLAEFITKDLGIKFPTTLIDNLLEALKLLFEEPEKAKAERAPRIQKGPVGGEDDEQNGEQNAEAVHSLPITSLQKAREHFPKIILSCDLQQYLVKFLTAGLLAIDSDLSNPILIVPAAHSDLFGENFSAAANEQLEKLIHFAFTPEVKKRKVQFSATILKKLFENKYPSIERIKTLWTELQIPQECMEFKLLTLLEAKGFKKAQVRDLHWLAVRLLEIATSVHTRNKSGAQKDEKVTEVDQLDSVLLAPLLHADRVLLLPYSAVFAFCELLPDVCAQILSTRLLSLCNIWGTPQQTDTRTCSELMLRIDACLDVVEKSGRECLRATLDLLNRNSASSQIDQRLSLKRGQMSLEILVPDTQSMDVATHVCNMESVEEAIYAAITKLGVSLCGVLTALFEHYKATLKLHNLDFKVRPVSELRSAEVLSVETLQSLLDHKAALVTPANFANVRLESLCEFIAPFRHLIVIQPIVYVKGTRTQMIPGNLLFRLREFLPPPMLAESKMNALPLCLEIADYITHRVEPAWLDSKEPLSQIQKLSLDQLLQLPDSHNYAFLSAKELSVCKEQVRSLYHKFVSEKQKSVASLLQSASVSLLMRPDFEKLEKKKVFETEPLPGIFMVQHALMLDENSMPIIQEGELQRDPNSAKTRQPVMRIVELEKEVPTAKRTDLPSLASADAISTHVPAFHIGSLLQRQQQFEERLERALEITWNSINKPYLKDLIAEFDETQVTGCQMNLPSGKVGPPYAYQLIPQKAFYGAKMTALRNMLNNVGAQSEKCIKDFQISRRPSLPMEMLTYVSLLEGCAFKEESKLRRLAEAAMCAQVMASDVNYHVLLEDTSIIKFLCDIVKRIGERLFQVEAQKNGGTILICFPCSAKGLGIMCVSSTFKKKSKTWQRFLHYNPNACASEEFHRCTEHTPPYVIGGGVVYEEIFAGANKRNILLSFTKQAIKQKKSALNVQAKEALQKGDVHDESHLGRNLNLGHINWVVRKDDDQLTLNHLHCEAALCNASPLIPLERVEVAGEGARLQLKVTYVTVRETLEKCLSNRAHISAAHK